MLCRSCQWNGLRCYKLKEGLSEVTRTRIVQDLKETPFSINVDECTSKGSNELIGWINNDYLQLRRECLSARSRAEKFKDPNDRHKACDLRNRLNNTADLKKRSYGTFEIQFPPIKITPIRETLENS